MHRSIYVLIGEAVGISVGIIDGDNFFEGDTVGLSVGLEDGSLVGTLVRKATVGRLLGVLETITEGFLEGISVGLSVGLEDGRFDGTLVTVGRPLGVLETIASDGIPVGANDELLVGALLGTPLGAFDKVKGGKVGTAMGTKVGFFEGIIVGLSLGMNVLRIVGTIVLIGIPLGLSDGRPVD